MAQRRKATTAKELKNRRMIEAVVGQHEDEDEVLYLGPPSAGFGQKMAKLSRQKSFTDDDGNVVEGKEDEVLDLITQYLAENTFDEQGERIYSSVEELLEGPMQVFEALSVTLMKVMGMYMESKQSEDAKIDDVPLAITPNDGSSVESPTMSSEGGTLTSG